MRPPAPTLNHSRCLTQSQRHREWGLPRPRPLPTVLPPQVGFPGFPQHDDASPVSARASGDALGSPAGLAELTQGTFQPHRSRDSSCF